MKSIKHTKAICFAVLAATLYAISSPISKLLLFNIAPTMMAACLYLGAGAGLLLFSIGRRLCRKTTEELSLTIKEIPYTIAMVVLDIAAPIFLMIGLTLTTAANVSLLNNFEIVATSIIASLVFGEAISKRLWMGIGLVTLASLVLSIEDVSSFSFSFGSLFVLLACICWGIENNCTRMLSSKDPIQIVIIKGIGSGTGSLVLALLAGESFPQLNFMVIAFLLGFVAYGLSIVFYIYAQRYLGAAKTSAYYAITPFIGSVLSLLIFRQIPSVSFVVAIVIMAAGSYFVSKEE